jgi:hypothetical protein
MTAILAFAARFKIYLAIAGLVAVALTLAYCSGKREGRVDVEHKIEQANTKAVQRNAAAGEKAAEARVADAQTVLEMKEELVDAVEATPDTLPSDRRIARGCVQLRQAGRDTDAIPACAGH